MVTKAARVVLFDDGSYLFYSTSGGRWKEIAADGKMTGADARILQLTDAEGYASIVQHRLDYGHPGDPTKEHEDESEGQPQPGQHQPTESPTHRTGRGKRAG